MNFTWFGCIGCLYDPCNKFYVVNLLREPQNKSLSSI